MFACVDMCIVCVSIYRYLYSGKFANLTVQPSYVNLYGKYLEGYKRKCSQ